MEPKTDLDPYSHFNVYNLEKVYYFFSKDGVLRKKPHIRKSCPI